MASEFFTDDRVSYSTTELAAPGRPLLGLRAWDSSTRGIETLAKVGDPAWGVEIL
jgi:hypothetical protein